MAHYRIITVQRVPTAGFETTIGGPGIPAGGIRYRFDSEAEAHSFIENLNLSYSEARRLMGWRKAQLRNQIRVSRRPLARANGG
jgi:hypothetical protein